MKKLTVEQSHWLLENLSRLKPQCRTDGESWVKEEKMVQIINQCTEKPFPELYISQMGCDADAIRIYSNKSTENSCECNIELYTITKFTHFTKDEFKQFTEGCNKIVSWLDEQNDS